MKYDLSNLKKPALIVSAVAVIAGSAAGLGSTVMMIDECSSTVTRYVTAEYSEVSVNFDGEVEVDSWSEKASKVNSITTVNELPEYPKMPPHDKRMSNGADFDKFKFHTDTNLSVVASSYANGVVYFEDPIHKAGSCVSKLGEPVDVKTWYGMTYGSDF